MSVPLHLSSRLKQCPPAWQNFVAHHNKLMREQNQDCQLLMKHTLEQYDAWTNWEDDADPIWFPDQDSFTQFVLTWS